MSFPISGNALVDEGVVDTAGWKRLFGNPVCVSLVQLLVIERRCDAINHGAAGGHALPEAILKSCQLLGPGWNTIAGLTVVANRDVD